MMILSALLMTAAVLVSAEPQRYRSQYGTPDSEVEAAPYQPSGWRPSGRQFLLPVRQSAPVYYAPPEQYGPPSTEAAPANVTEEEEPATTTTELPTTTDLPTTTENPDEQADGNSQDPNSQRFQQQREQEDLDTGLYYVLLPDGRLQRVAYSGSRLAAQPQQQQRQKQQLFSEQPHQLTNGYYAQIQYHDVEPIKAPIYTYSAPLIRLYK